MKFLRTTFTVYYSDYKTLQGILSYLWIISHWFHLIRRTKACVNENQKMGITFSCLWLHCWIHKWQRQCVCRFFCPGNPWTLSHLLRNKSLQMSCLSKETSFLNASVFSMETRQDPVLSKVLQYSQKGWPDNPVLQLYYSRRLDLSHEEGLLLWNSRVIVPE